MTVLHPTIK